MQWVKRVIGLLAIVAVITVGALTGWSWHVLRSSLPVLDGVVRVSGTKAVVTISRDASGVPAITAASRVDSAFAIGFLHAQERFFQMDLARRIAAGELAELFGSNVVELDRRFRLHRLRSVADRAVDLLPDGQRAVLRAYVEGVNAGLDALGHAPLEYTISGTEPRRWTEADTLLVILNMFILLQDHDGSQELSRSALYAELPHPLADFLGATGDPDWDAALDDSQIPLPAMPGPTVWDAHGEPAATAASGEPRRGPLNGSNAWVVSGLLTDDGASIVANDMHLAFGVPTTFYRAELRIGDDDDGQRLVGLTLPGVPVMVVGSNGRIAWGFSNSAVDAVDLVELSEFDSRDGTYSSGDGRGNTRLDTEQILVNGETAQTLEIRSTEWGPVLGEADGRAPHAIRWVAHDPAAVGLGLLDLEMAGSVQEAVALAGSAGIPAQNMVVGDRWGAVGWTIAGRLPMRAPGSGLVPLSSKLAKPPPERLHPADENPRVLNPPHGRIWTANARVMGGEALQTLGFGYYALGARARQLRDRLFELSAADETAMRELQMDHRALFMMRWRDLLSEAIARYPDAPRREQLSAIVVGWDGSASADSVAYPLIRGFRERVVDLVFAPYVSAARRTRESFTIDSLGDQYEAPLWRLVTERPSHLLPPSHASWSALLDSALADEVIDLDAAGGAGRVTWGDRHQLEMQHPMSAFIPGFPTLYDMPRVALHGDLHMPLSQTSDHGPVQRMVIRPGRESEGSLCMPVGQSGHPLSPYYAAGHGAWLEGEYCPLLAGAEVYRLDLVPR